MIFPDGSVREVDEADVATARSLGATEYTGQKTNGKGIEMQFPGGTVRKVDSADLAIAESLGGVKKKEAGGEDLQTGTEPMDQFSLRGMTAMASTSAGIQQATSKNPYSNVLSAIQDIDLPQEQKSKIYEDAVNGDVRPLVDVVKAERERLKQNRQNAIRGQESFPTSMGTMISVRSSSQEEPFLPEDREKITTIQENAAAAIDNIYAEKLLSLQGGSLTENAKTIGKERRQMRSEIGAEGGFQDELGATKSALENRTAFGWFNLNPEKYEQEHDFKNEAGVYVSALQKLEGELVELSNYIQQQGAGTPEQKEALRNDPLVEEYAAKSNRYDFLKNNLEQLPNKYPQVLFQLQRQKFAEAWAEKVHMDDEQATKFGLNDPLYQLREIRKIFKGDKPDTEAEYQEIADATNTDVERVKEVLSMQDIGGQILIPSRLGRVWRSAVGVTQTATQGLNRVFGNKDRSNVINREIQETIYERPKVLNEKWNADRIFDLMANGMGQFIGFVGTGGAVSAPAAQLANTLVRGERVLNAINKGINIGTTFGTGYASSLESAYQYAASQTDDEGERWRYANGVAIANGASELLLRDVDVAQKVLKGKSSIKALEDLASKQTGYTAGDVFKARMADAAKVMGYESAEELIPFFTEVFQKSNSFDYRTSTAEVLKGAFNTILETAISTLPMAGFSASNVTTRNFMATALYEAAKTPDQFKQKWEQLYDDGVISNDVKNKNIQMVNTIADIYSKIPDEVEGKKLNDQDKALLLNSIVGKRQLEDYKKKVDEEFQAGVDNQIAQVKENINEIIRPAQQPKAPALTEQEKSVIDLIKEKKELSFLDPATQGRTIYDAAQNPETQKEAIQMLVDQSSDPDALELSVGAKITEAVLGLPQKSNQKTQDELTAEANNLAEALQPIRPPEEIEILLAGDISKIDVKTRNQPPKNVMDITTGELFMNPNSKKPMSVKAVKTRIEKRHEQLGTLLKCLS